MGCCFSGEDYAPVSDQVSLADNLLPRFTSGVTRPRDLSEEEAAGLKALFDEFAEGEGDDTISREGLERGLVLLKKNPSKKAVGRIMKTCHLSSAPAGRVDFKGFSLAVLSRKGLLYEFL